MRFRRNGLVSGHQLIETVETTSLEVSSQKSLTGFLIMANWEILLLMKLDDKLIFPEIYLS